MTDSSVSDDSRDPTMSVGFRDRVRYHFDNLLSRGTWAVLLVLGAATLIALIVSAGLLAAAGVTFAGSEGSSFLEDFWQSMLRAIDPGTMVADVGWGRRLLALLVTLFGILIAGTLIGLIASGVEQRVEQMQRGRSVVVESDHVLILGASDRLPVIVNQLALANRKRRANAIVVLADREPRELSEEVRSLVTNTYGSRLVFRFGDPTRRVDLAMVGVRRARAVIVLADDDVESDAGVVKSTLAVGAELGRFDRIPIVTELSDVESAEVLSAACGGHIHPIVPAQGLARVTAFTLGEPGLNQVVEELLDFRGSDLYVLPVGDLEGSTFGHNVCRFTKVRPIGRMGPNGEVELNPPPDSILGASDRLVVIADDDQSALTPRKSQSKYSAPSSARPPLEDRRRREHFLIVGWNSLGSQLLGQLERVSETGSTMRVVYDARLFGPEEMQFAETDRLRVTFTPSTRDVWQPSAADQLSEVTSVVFLGYRRGTSTKEADTRTLLNIMLLKRRMAQLGIGPRIVAELINADNVDLARLSGADDFLVSDAIASRFLTQLADQPERRPVLLSLFGSEGPSVHLVEAEELGVAGEHTWDEIIDAVYSEGLLAIGWRRDSARGGDVTLNPHTSDPIVLDSDDRIVVIG